MMSAEEEVAPIEIGSHATTIPIIKFGENGEVSFAIMKYSLEYPDGKIWDSIRHVTETGKNSESVVATLRRGVEEEAVENKNNFSIESIDLLPLTPILGRDDREEKKKHLKAAFITFLKGELRTRIIREHGERGWETHGPMQWVEAKNLLKHWMVGTMSVRYHVDVTYAVLERLAEKSSAIAERYMNLLNWESRVELSDEESEAVEQYLLKRSK